MLYNTINKVRNFLSISVSEENKNEFTIGINRINIMRAKITSATFIALEMMQLAAYYIIKGQSFLKKPAIYYGVMYVLLLIVMILFLFIFIKLGKDIPKYRASIRIAAVFFVSSILLWCASISLLDQLSSGQIIVYTVAIIAIAVTPVLKPAALLIMYLVVQILFSIFLPYFQKSTEMLFGNYVNSTTFLIISWAISYMRYKKQVDDFNNGKLIQEKSDELKRLNKELEEANRELEKLSQTDSLTGISNRMVFDTVVKSEWDRCKRHFIPLTLIMIDIDFFKAFNDNYGHQAGDYCIKQVAAVLLDYARRSTDIVSRYGGEEFAIILPYMDKEGALEFAEQMRRKVEELDIPHIYSTISEHVTISLGVHTAVPSETSSIEQFIRAADKALYEAKKHRNTVTAA